MRLCSCILKKVLLFEKRWLPGHTALPTRWTGHGLEQVGEKRGTSLPPPLALPLDKVGSSSYMLWL